MLHFHVIHMLCFFSQRSTKAQLLATRKLSVFFPFGIKRFPIGRRAGERAAANECASHRDATRRTPIINRASAAGKKGICARAPKRNKTKLLMCAGLIQKIKRFQQIVAKVLRARRLNFLSAHAARGKTCSQQKGFGVCRGKILHLAQLKSLFILGTLQISTSICTSFKTNFSTFYPRVLECFKGLL
jgi:hypothetical protein